MKNLLMMVVIMGVSLSASAALVDYQFNDAAGTDWQSLAQDGTDASQWNFNVAEGLADGAGNVHLTGLTTDYTRWSDLSAPLTDGIVSLEVRFSDWDMSNSPDTSGTGFGLGGDLKLRIEVRDGGTNLRINSIGASGVGGETKRKVLNGASIASEGLLIRAEVDLTNDTYSTMWKLDGDAGWTALSTGATFTADVVKLGGFTEGSTAAWGAGDFIDVDYVTMDYTPVPEPATMVILGLGGLFLRRKRM